MIPITSLSKLKLHMYDSVDMQMYEYDPNFSKTAEFKA